MNASGYSVSWDFDNDKGKPLSSTQQHPFRDHLHIFGPGIAITLLGFLLAFQFVKPAPPDQITIATGGMEGAYSLFGQQYRDYLKRENIELRVLNTKGSVENIQLLESGKADIAFVQGGTEESSKSEELISLGSLYFEPIWVFHRGDLTLEQLTGLDSSKIAIGPEGSGTRAVALQLLSDNSITDANAELLELSGRPAADALLGGQIDAAFFVASPQSAVVRALLDSTEIALMNFKRADAYTRLHRYLSPAVLPEGVINLRHNLPRQETRLLAASANLVAHQDLHPALIDLLLQAASESHGEGGWFEQAGQFPSPDYLIFPLSKEAKRFYEFGPPLLQRYLPFWAATLVDRLKVMLLPLLALMIPLFKVMPPIYRWRIRSRIYRWYREVLEIDRHSDAQETKIEVAMEELDAIDREVSKVSVPLSYAEELYDLRLHIGLVREKLERLRNG
ncbi:MAG: TAXI family TRAP transporter solute-binding subunit [Candidatus Sedimenticola sp. PURPLELP]